MTLDELGYYSVIDKYKKEFNWNSFETGRVTQEHKERYIISTGEKEYTAEITGNLRFSSSDRTDFPAVGDWVAFKKYEEVFALIHHIFPRKTLIERQAVEKFGEKQIIAANIDKAFIIQGFDQDFNINRIERYLTIVKNAKVDPIIIFSKADLISDHEIESRLVEIKSRIKHVPVIVLSNLTKKGIELISHILRKGLTFCCLGSSGVGKSTLINTLAGEELLKTNDISDSTHKGKHTTSYRELIVLKSGGILIDTPGMREIGMHESSDGIELTFDLISQLTKSCAFSDCMHIHEEGCAVKAAIERGEIAQESLDNYLKIDRENRRFTESISEKRRKEKAFGRMCKNVMKFKNDNK